MESCQYRGYQIEARQVVDLVRQCLSHTLRPTDLAATNFVQFDAAKGRCAAAKQSIDRILSNLDSWFT